MRSLGWITASVFTAIAVVGVAVPAEAAPVYPSAVGRCVDQTGVLGPDLCTKVTAILLREEKSASDEIAVAVVPTTGDSSIEAWSTGLFNTWGVGKKWKNNGVLLVVALDDHKVRLETGRGMANRLSDSDAVNIVGDVTSHFSEEEYALGILTGLDDVRRQLGHAVPPSALLAPLAATAPAEPDLIGSDGSDVSSNGSEFTSPEDFASVDDGAVPVLPIAIGGLAIVLLLAVVVAVSRGSSGSTRRGRSSFAQHGPTHQTMWTPGINDSSSTTGSSFSSDSSGSSSSSFGGGSSDGGGATGSW